MRAAIEQVFDGSIAQVAVGGAYDPTKINRGKHGGQYDLGPGPNDRFVGPCPVGVANFGESPLALASPFIHVLKITDDLFWIFGADASSAAATRRVQLWTFTPSTNAYTLVGSIILTFPTATTHTTRGMRVILTNVTTGTAGVSGTAVTGSGTTWNSTRPICVGSRIGFGSTNPNAITTWYQVGAVGSDTSITLTSSAGTISSGTPYVIQDLMLVHTTTNATVTNGGMFVAKGLRYEDFASSATTIPAATTVDRIKAVYWLRDAATVTNTVATGCAIDDAVSMTEQYAYVTDGSASSLKIYRYNFRAPLTSLSAGAQTLTGTDVIVTGAQTVTGTLFTVNNGRVATLQHGPGNGVPSLYIGTSTRILRVPLSSITNGSTLLVADTMIEGPPGGPTTNASIGSSPFTAFDIAGSIDKVVIAGSGVGSTLFVTDYVTTGRQFDRRAGCLTTQLPSALRDRGSPIFIHNSSSFVPTLWVEDGWLFWLYNTTTTPTANALSAYPLAADLLYQPYVSNRIVCPKISFTGIPSKLYRVAVNPVTNLGDWVLGVGPDAYCVQYRTSGIDDNSGTWFDVPPNGDLSGVAPAPAIQFAFLFRTLGTVMLPARILSLALIYESQDSLPPQYRWNFEDFSTTSGTFAWVQASTFGTALPTHTINIYRGDTGALVLTQASTGSAVGTFQHWNGSTWTAGLGPDTVGTRRRFVPSAGLPSGVALYAEVVV